MGIRTYALIMYYTAMLEKSVETKVFEHNNILLLLLKLVFFCFILIWFVTDDDSRSKLVYEILYYVTLLALSNHTFYVKRFYSLPQKNKKSHTADSRSELLSNYL